MNTTTELIRNKINSDCQAALTSMIKDAAHDVNYAAYHGELLPFLKSHALEVRRTHTGGIEIVLTIGGPSIWVSTRRAKVFGMWGNLYSAFPVAPETVAEINRVFSGYY